MLRGIYIQRGSYYDLFVFSLTLSLEYFRFPTYHTITGIIIAMVNDECNDQCQCVIDQHIEIRFSEGEIAKSGPGMLEYT